MPEVELARLAEDVVALVFLALLAQLVPWQTADNHRRRMTDFAAASLVDGATVNGAPLPDHILFVLFQRRRMTNRVNGLACMLPVTGVLLPMF